MRNPLLFLAGFLVVWSIFGWWFFTTCDCSSEIAAVTLAAEGVNPIDKIEVTKEESIPVQTQEQEAVFDEKKAFSDWEANTNKVPEVLKMSENLALKDSFENFKNTLSYNSVEDSLNLKVESFRSLVSYLNAYPNALLYIEGHYHFTGFSDEDQKFGYQISKTMKDDLVAKGLPEEQIKIYSKGSEAPIASNGYEQGRAINRRLNIWIKHKEN